MAKRRRAARAKAPGRTAAAVIARGRRVVAVEAKAVAALSGRIGDGFARAAEAVAACRGKVVVTGMGKSGQVARKIAATLASTGTPALYLHAGEAGHGDLGVLSAGDLILAVSYSGETEELSLLLPAIRRLGLPMVALTGAPRSTLGRAADLVLDVSVREEACPLGLAPTASTTATLAMGDALAVAVYGARGFSPGDFALRHPGGSLGRALLVRVEDLMHTGEAVPRVRLDAPLRDALVEMTRKRFGFTTVVDPRGRLRGILTDGDLRRVLQKGVPRLLDSPVRGLMTPRPRTVAASALAAEALRTMEERKITSLVVLGPRGSVRGVVHLHDILAAKIDSAIGA